MVVSVEPKENFDKIQYNFLLKTLSKINIEGIFCNTIKAICEKLQVNIRLKRGKSGGFPTRIWN